MRVDQSRSGVARILLSAMLAACGGSTPQQVAPIEIDGSSTVYPITVAVVEAFQQSQSPEAEISVSFSGTGGGFEKFCAGETQINDASRPILLEEVEACKQAGVPFIELPIAYDALTVVVNPENDWVDHLTVDELRQIWSSRSQRRITDWDQIRSEWPDEPLELYGPGADSGTFDYFIEAIEARRSRSDYVASEDDEVIAQGVIREPNGLGYFGFAYYEENQDQLRAVPIDNGEGPILPSQETVEDGSYQPLSRPLFIYVNQDAALKNPLVEEFVEFYLEAAPGVAQSVGYVPLPEEGYTIAEITLQQGEVGTVFEGKPQPNLRIADLLRKRAQY